MISIWLLFSLLFVSAWAKDKLSVEPKIKDAKVIVCAIVKNEEQYIDEWLRYQKYLGFDHAYLHDNDIEPSKYLASLPEIYGDFVKVMRHPGLNQQRVAYKVCLDEYKNNNTWAAFIDVDEFIVLRKHKNIKDFLRDVGSKGGSVVLNWSRFSNSGIKTHEEGPVVSRFTWTTKELDHHTKAIAYLPHATRIEIHNTMLLPGHVPIDVQGRQQREDWPWVEENKGNKDIAYINHYHTKSLEELVQKRSRGYADLKDGGPIESHEEVLKKFDEYNQDYHEVEELYARDFYLQHYLGVPAGYNIKIETKTALRTEAKTTLQPGRSDSVPCSTLSCAVSRLFRLFG